MSIIKSYSVGDGDMFYIEHNTDNFSVIDCCYEDEDSRDENFEQIKQLAEKKGVVRFISTHPDEDHIKGLPEMDDKISIRNFYCVENKAIKKDESENFDKYCELRDSEKAYYVKKGCSRKWMNRSSDERGSAGINYLWPDVDNEEYKKALKKVEEGTDFNNISPIFTYSLENGARFMWMGDMENEFREKIKDSISWPKVDVLFAPHHGRESGKVSKDILDEMEVKLIVIGEAPSEYLDYYNGYNTITQNSTEDIIFNCVEGYIHIYVKKESYPYSTEFLENLDLEDESKGQYLGSLKTHESE